MRHERATEELRELAALYALGALTQQEARSFELHMREECPVCEAAFVEFQRIVAGIGLAVEEAEAPEYLRDLLTARIERAKRASAKPEAPEKAVETGPQPKKAPSLPAPRLFQFQQPPLKTGFQAVVPYVLAAIAASLIISALIAWRSAHNSEIQMRAKLSAAVADAENLRILLDVKDSKALELEQILTLAGKAGVRMARLAGEPASPDSSAAVLWDAQQGKCLVFGHLPAETDGKVYQLWFLKPLEKISAGILKPDPTGRVFSTIPIPPNAAGTTAIAVSAEPGGASALPTLPYHAAGRLE